MTLSSAATVAFRAYLDAAIVEGAAIIGAEDAFRVSAIAHAKALMAGGEAKAIAAANKATLAPVKGDLPKDCPVYTVGSAVGYHALAGRVFMLPLPAHSMTYREVQTVVRTATDTLGTRDVKARVDAAVSGKVDQKTFVADLEAAVAAWRKAKAKAEKEAAASREETAEGDAGTPAKDVALTLLQKVAALLEGGHAMSDEAKALLITLADVVAPIKVAA